MEGDLVIEKNEEEMNLRTKIIEDLSSISIISNEIRKNILKLLSEKPYYPAELAKKLKLHEQKVYYHIKQLINGGFIEESERKEIRGTIAKKFKTSANSYTYIINEKWKKTPKKGQIMQNKELLWFFEPFIENGFFNGKIIVGSPDAHGRYKAYAKDGHYSSEISLLIGNLAKIPKNFSVWLDVDVKKEGLDKENLIIIGGPVTNTITYELNDKLPVSFIESPWGLKSRNTGKSYYGENIGLIQLIKSPFNSEKWILHIAGIRSSGTKSAIIALTKDQSPIRKAYLAKKRPFYSIVEGFDVDGDGNIESIEIKE